METQSKTFLLKAPFPWFGGKLPVAAEVWRRFGNVERYIEPFCGSAAVLLARPRAHAPYKNEIINDKNGQIVNLYRAIKADPETVWRFADHMPSEIDLRARRKAINNALVELNARLESDPDYYDARLAGWWVYGASLTIGGSWAKNKITKLRSTQFQGLYRRQGGRLALLQALTKRLQDVCVHNGDWKRCVTPIMLDLRQKQNAHVAVLLDPPYLDHDRYKKIYGNTDNSDSARESYTWAVETAAALSNLRIAYCTYLEHFPCPEGWSAYTWKANGGYGNHRKNEQNKNRNREVIYFSPSCLNGEMHQATLFKVERV